MEMYVVFCYQFTGEEESTHGGLRLDRNRLRQEHEVAHQTPNLTPRCAACAAAGGAASCEPQEGGHAS